MTIYNTIINTANIMTGNKPATRPYQTALGLACCNPTASKMEFKLDIIVTNVTGTAQNKIPTVKKHDAWNWNIICCGNGTVIFFQIVPTVGSAAGNTIIVSGSPVHSHWIAACLARKLVNVTKAVDVVVPFASFDVLGVVVVVL